MLVSVIIPTYNRAESYLGQTVDSVFRSLLDQQLRLEVIIVDDASVDNTEEIVATLQHKYKQIKYIRNDSHRGPAFSRHCGLNQAQGEMIIDLDDDDIVPQYGIALRCEWLRTSKATWLYGDAFQIDESNTLLADQPLTAKHVEGADAQFSAFYDQQLFAFSGTKVYLATALRVVGDWDNTTHPYLAEDFELWLRLTSHGFAATYLPIPTVFYRKKMNSLGVNAQRSGELEQAAITIRQKYLSIRDKVRQP